MQFFFSKTSMLFCLVAATVIQVRAFVVVPSSFSSLSSASVLAPHGTVVALNMASDSDEGAEETPETTTTSKNAFGRDDFVFSFEIPKKGIADVGSAEVSLPPVLEQSEVVIVRYELPFGLNAEPNNDKTQVVVTQDGKADGGERVGDILRQTTYWRGKTPGLFDVSKNADNFDLVIQALVTNDLSVADEIVLVFERPL